MKRPVLVSQKLISFLQEAFAKECSGKFFRRVLESNLCRVNGRVERFGSSRVQRGDVVELSSTWREFVKPKTEFKILYEDDSIQLIDKPAGWVCSEENCRRTFGSEYGLIHRLDKDTTGVLCLAKQRKSSEEWMELFAARKVEKEYLALVDGVPKQPEGVLDSLFERKRTLEGQTIWGSGTRGLRAITKWKVLAEGKNCALLLVQPFTGRTHQIRVHLAEMGHPILVDRQYADRFRSPLFARRPLLHAFRLRCAHVCAEAPLPSDMKQAFLDGSIHSPLRGSAP